MNHAERMREYMRKKRDPNYEPEPIVQPEFRWEPLKLSKPMLEQMERAHEYHAHRSLVE